jgi:hypothetical protein
VNKSLLALAGCEAARLRRAASLGFSVNSGRRRASLAPPCGRSSGRMKRRPFGIGFSLGLGPTPGFLHKR